MDGGKIVWSGVAGTSLMTLFSYIVSRNRAENFKEPELLAALEKELLPPGLKEFALPAGWSTHYSIGIVWAIAYHLLWQKNIVEPTVKNGLLLGGISGLIGVAFWDACFKMHPRPPRIKYRLFYGQLVLAHLIYGAVTTISGRNNK